MRELEFLPSWYNQNRRCRRIVGWQAYVLLILITCMSTWTIMTHRSVRAAERTLDSVDEQLTQSRADQALLAEKLDLRQKLQAQEELLGSLGHPVEMTRLLQLLDTLMPKQMSLVEFDCTTEEVPRPVVSVAAVKQTTDRKSQMQWDRRLKIRLLGVAPSNSDLAAFVAGLASRPFFEQVALPYSKSVFEGEHELREFSVTFVINLSQIP